MSGHRAAHDLAQAAGAGALSIPDPGDGGIISIDRQGVCELITAAAETRTLPDPPGPGLRVCLRMKTDGGDCVITSTSGVNVAGNTTITFDAVGEQLDMISVSDTTGYRFEVITNTGTVGLA